MLLVNHKMNLKMLQNPFNIFKVAIDMKLLLQDKIKQNNSAFLINIIVYLDK